MSTRRIPIARQSISQADIDSVVETLRSDWLTTGPKVDQFEKSFCEFTGAKYAVAVMNGTAALHCAYHAIDLKPGDEVIVPAITFAATANAVLYNGAKPVFADVDASTLLINPDSVQALLSPRTKAITAVDYAGQPCDYGRLQSVAQLKGITLIADACHALGGSYNKAPVGTLAKLSTFSFHPVKPITTGEGGMITTDDQALASKMKIFRNHGITTDHRQREVNGTWEYDMVTLGYNLRLPDILCALGIEQLKRTRDLMAKRVLLAKRYHECLAGSSTVTPLGVNQNADHAYHLLIVKLAHHIDRQDVFGKLRALGIGAGVHYKPVYLHSYYQSLGYKQGQCPVAEENYSRIMSLPIFPDLPIGEVDRICDQLLEICRSY